MELPEERHGLQQGHGLALQPGRAVLAPVRPQDGKIITKI